MFGTYRTLLALVVVFHHLMGVPVVGHHAVFGFFILSGYLMTYIMHNTYGYGIDGVKRFMVNRFLRLYPTYWAVLVITIVIILVFGESNANTYWEFMTIPRSLADIFQNVSLLFFNLFPIRCVPRLSPPVWTLTTEIFYYLLIAMGLSKTRKRVLVWLAAGVLYTIVVMAFRPEYRYQYTIIFAGSLPFSLGAVLYFYRDRMAAFFAGSSKILSPLILMILFCINSSLVVVLPQVLHTYKYHPVAFYLNMVIQFALVAGLISRPLPLVTKSLDKKLGDLSYPIYLLHCQIGFVVSMILYGMPIKGYSFRGIVAGLIATLVTVGVSCGLVNLVDYRIEKFRKVIRDKAKMALKS
ncbi:MAG: acyltransferase [Sedimentisphaerales bacterium]|nr:acyltransferase [Sedimentisphaerales bacterium]